MARGAIVRLWSEVRERAASLLRRSREDAELDEELRFHLERDVERRMRGGATRAEAERAARRAFGPVSRAREDSRDARGVRPLEDLARDVRFGARSLRAAPGFSVVAVLALGLGIGAATAMYGVLDAILLRPLPYPSVERLYSVHEANEDGNPRQLSYPDFADWRAAADGVVSLGYARGDVVTVRGPEGGLLLGAAYVTPDFFDVAGAPALVGRTFGSATDAAAGESHLVVLSHRLWKDHFGGDPAVVGRPLTTTDATFTVVGVMPPGFALPTWAELWFPLAALPAGARYALERRDLRVDSHVYGRLTTGVGEEQARSALSAIAAAVADQHRSPDGWRAALLTSVRESLLGDTRPRLFLLLAAVGLLLLVACVNVAGLQLARATARGPELGVRAALGAGRGRLIRQLLTESALVALAGAVVGVALAAATLRTIQARVPDLLPRLGDAAIDGRVLAVALLITLGTTLLVGLVPAFRAAGRSHELRPGARSRPASTRLRSALAVTQVGLALVLVVGSGLLLRSLWQLQDVDLGFDPDGVALVRVFPPSPRYDDEAAAANLYRQLREATAAVPGVTDAALVNHMPMAGGWMPSRVVAGSGAPPGESELALLRTVSPEYFRVLRSELIQGRLLDDADMAGGGGVVVNRTVAERFWPGEDPVGRSVTVFASAQGRPGFGEPITGEVAGVVADERFFGPESNAPAAVYIPWTRNVWGSIFVTVRTGTDPERVIPDVRRALLAVDPDLPIAGPGAQTRLRTLDSFVADGFQARRVSALLLAGFGAVAFLLAALGVFGTIAYLVTLRRHEMGVRLALGAGRGRLAWLVTRHALRLVLAGVVLGLVASAVGVRFLSAQLYGVSALDPVTFSAAAALFTLAALAAALVPARRAARTDPVEALRAER